MQSVFYRYFGVGLAVLLVLTSQSMAVARGESDPSGQLVLCTGTGPVVVFVDDDGVPVNPPHFCPDCALTMLDGVVGPSALVHRVDVETRLSAVEICSENRVPDLPRRMARAPPVAV